MVQMVALLETAQLPSLVCRCCCLMHKQRSPAPMTHSTSRLQLPQQLTQPRCQTGSLLSQGLKRIYDWLTLWTALKARGTTWEMPSCLEPSLSCCWRENQQQ